MTWGRILTPESTAPETPVIREGEDEYALKLAYARAVFELGTDWARAGFVVFQGPNNYGRALQASSWISDFDVQEELKRLRRDPAETLPSDDEIESALFAIVKSPTAADRDKVSAATLIWEKRGKVKRGASTNINNGVINNNVLRVPAKPKTAEELETYEMRLKASQLKLVSDARSSK